MNHEFREYSRLSTCFLHLHLAQSFKQFLLRGWQVQLGCNVYISMITSSLYSLGMLSTLTKCRCTCFITFSGHCVNEPSSFRTTLGLAGLHPASTLFNRLILSHLIQPSFLAVSTSLATWHIQLFFAKQTAYFTTLCDCLNPLLLAGVLDIKTLRGIKLTKLSSNHSGCFFSTLPCDSSAAATKLIPDIFNIKLTNCKTFRDLVLALTIMFDYNIKLRSHQHIV